MTAFLHATTATTADTHTDDGRQIDGEREKEKESEREWKKANDDERVRERGDGALEFVEWKREVQA